MADVDARGRKRTKVTSTFHSRVDRLLNAADMTSPGRAICMFIVSRSLRMLQSPSESDFSVIIMKKETFSVIHSRFPVRTKWRCEGAFLNLFPSLTFGFACSVGETAIYGDVRSYECKLLPLAL